MTLKTFEAQIGLQLDDRFESEAAPPLTSIIPPKDHLSQSAYLGRVRKRALGPPLREVAAAPAQ